jgi:L-ascorbate metabolism protein UlaG (beta-lactamase superfamily)
MRAFLTLSFTACFLLGSQQTAPPGEELELHYLANEGFYLRHGEHALVIDAFVTEPYGGYAVVPAELFQALLEGQVPFQDVDLALTSHFHRDHFQAEAAARFFAARPAIPFLSAPQVLAELEKHSPAKEGIEPFLPEKSERAKASAGAIQIEFLRLPHSGGAPAASVENLGHVVDLGGVRVLHVGDAAAEVEDLAAYDLAQSNIDLALVPYWWLGDARDLERVRQRTGAKHLVAAHVPPKEVAEVKAHLAALEPALILFEKPGDSRKLTLAH